MKNCRIHSKRLTQVREESQVQEVDWISLIEILAKGRFKTSSLPAK